MWSDTSVRQSTPLATLAAPVNAPTEKASPMSGFLKVEQLAKAYQADKPSTTFADIAGLAKWPAVDRGVLSFKSEAEIAAVAPAIADLFARWLAATT